MAGIDEVLERLVVEPDFRSQLRLDPATALSGYVLYDEDLEILAASLDESEGGDHTVEQRTSKSAFLASVLGGFEGWGGVGGTSSDLAAPPDASETPTISSPRVDGQEDPLQADDVLASEPGEPAPGNTTEDRPDAVEQEGSSVTSGENEVATKKDGTISIRGKDISVTGNGA